MGQKINQEILAKYCAFHNEHSNASKLAEGKEAEDEHKNDKDQSIEFGIDSFHSQNHTDQYTQEEKTVEQSNARSQRSTSATMARARARAGGITIQPSR